jgi:hypothetical protein
MHKRLATVISLGLMFFIGSANADVSSAVTQSYNAGNSILSGMLVKLKNKSSNTVVPLTSSTISKMLGVVVPLNQAPIILSSPTSTNQQVLIATSGQYNVLVSNQNGLIKSGDRLTISSTAGIAMKADSTEPEIIGQAEAGFNGSSDELGSETVKDSTGKTIKEEIGSIPVSVSLGANPIYSKNTSKLPGFVSKTANQLAGKQVSFLHVILSGVILLMTMIISISLLYGGARSRLIAIGRNPLAKSSIGRGLLAIVTSGLVVFIIGILVSYFVIKV